MPTPMMFPKSEAGLKLSDRDPRGTWGPRISREAVIPASLWVSWGQTLGKITPTTAKGALTSVNWNGCLARVARSQQAAARSRTGASCCGHGRWQRRNRSRQPSNAVWWYMNATTTATTADRRLAIFALFFTASSREGRGGVYSETARSRPHRNPSPSPPAREGRENSKRDDSENALSHPSMSETKTQSIVRRGTRCRRAFWRLFAFAIWFQFRSGRPAA